MGTTGSTDGQAPQESTAPPGAPTTPSPEPSQAGSSTSTPPSGQEPKESRDPESYEAEIRRLREENAKHRKEKVDLKQQQLSQLPETERLQKELEELRIKSAALEAAQRQATFVAAAARSQAIDAEIVAKLVDPEESDVDGAIRQLKKDKPFLFQSSAPPPKIGSANAGAGTPGGVQTKPSMSDVIRRQLNIS